MTTKKKTSTDAKRRYNEKAYDRLSITVPKGDKDKIAAYAEKNGTTINRLVNDLLRETVEDMSAGK